MIKCNPAKTLAAVEDFGALHHRMEFVREFNGVSYYEDSKATNVGSVQKALESFENITLIAGGKDKCDYVVKELGFDACIDYKEHKDYLSLSKALREACPNGIDGHFENVGGMVLDAVMLRTNAFAPAAREALALATDSLRAAHLAYRAVHRATVARTLSDEEVAGVAILTREAQRILSEFGVDEEP